MQTNSASNAEITAETLAGIGRAHGKAILLGEHTVLHGIPAIGLPLPQLQATASASVSDDGRYNGVTLQSSGVGHALEAALAEWGSATSIDVTVECAFPYARGLGSSAASAAAAVRAAADLYQRTLDSDSLYRLVQVGEKATHGSASGIDARSVVSSQPIWFEMGRWHPLPCSLDAAFVLADTGDARDTAKAVATATTALWRLPRHGHQILENARALVTAAANDLAAGRARELGSRLTEFHLILAELGVTTPRLDHLIDIAMTSGALGAKLTGAGLGGCVLAIAATGTATVVHDALLAAGAAQAWIVTTESWGP